MSNSAINPFSFKSGFVQNKNVGRVIAQVDEIRDHGSTASRTMTWMGKQGGKWYSHTLDWTAIRVCVLAEPSILVVAMGIGGEIHITSSKGMAEEMIDQSNKGPGRNGDMRDLRLIGNQLYAVGMSRQVYRREGPNTWTRQDAGVLQGAGSKQVVGFNAIDGLTEQNLVAVGFGGEIWLRSKSVWQQVDSPTAVVLHSVRAIRNDLAYAAGQAGVLLMGSGTRWQIIEHNATDSDLWGMEWFNGKLYVAGDDGLFVLDHEMLVKVDIDLGEHWTCRHLHANDGVMWSFGPKHIVWTTDGKRWNDITP